MFIFFFKASLFWTQFKSISLCVLNSVSRTCIFGNHAQCVRKKIYFEITPCWKSFCNFFRTDLHLKGSYFERKWENLSLYGVIKNNIIPPSDNKGNLLDIVLYVSTKCLKALSFSIYTGCLKKIRPSYSVFLFTLSFCTRANSCNKIERLSRETIFVTNWKFWHFLIQFKNLPSLISIDQKLKFTINNMAQIINSGKKKAHEVIFGMKV